MRPDLTGVDLQGLHLNGVNLKYANLAKANLAGASFLPLIYTEVPVTRIRPDGKSIVSEAKPGVQSIPTDLSGANLNEAVLTSANLAGAFLCWANLVGADLSGSILTTTDLRWANMYRAKLVGAFLSQAKLEGASLVKADLSNADLNQCHVYGVSVWDSCLEGADQRDLVVTPSGQPAISVDNLEVAQFIYLLIRNEKIRSVIDTITSKVVLILGSFAPERKAILDAIREELRYHNLCPIVFDFDVPTSRDTHETVTILARLARFIVADITEPRSIPQELVSIVESIPSLPIQPILLEGHRPWGMYDHISQYASVLSIHRYSDVQDLLAQVGEKVVAPAETRAKELMAR